MGRLYLSKGYVFLNISSLLRAKVIFIDSVNGKFICVITLNDYYYLLKLYQLLITKQSLPSNYISSFNFLRDFICDVYLYQLAVINNNNEYQQRERMQQIQIKEELSKFINLLQSDYKTSSVSSQDRRSQYILNKKLSIILSASQPESSSLDKQNSNPSANRSFQTSSKVSQTFTQTLFQSLLNTQLTANQVKLVQKIKEHFDQLRAEVDRNESRLQQIQKDLSAQKCANDEMLTVLMKLDIQQKELWQNYNLVSEKYQELSQKFKESQEETQKLRNSVLSLQNDNDFMKKLIFHANQNYQALQRKCQDLEVLRQRSQANTDRKHIKKSSVDNLLKSAKTKKNMHSPAHSQIQNSPSIGDFQEMYRKMIVRTLKFKGRQHQFR